MIDSSIITELKRINSFLLDCSHLLDTGIDQTLNRYTYLCAYVLPDSLGRYADEELKEIHEDIESLHADVEWLREKTLYPLTQILSEYKGDSQT